MIHYSGLDYVRIDIASQFGMDKELFSARINWVHDNEDELEVLADKADDYYMYMKAVNAYRDSQQGIPTGYCLGLDATASGCSIMSVLSGDVKGALYTNLIDPNNRYDIYTVLVVEMNKILPETNQISLEKGDDNLTRDDCKQALMTVLYGSILTPKLIFGEGIELDAFYETLYKICPGALDVLDSIQSCWNPNTLVHTWSTDMGGTAHVPVTEMVDKRIEVDGLGSFTFRSEVNQPQDRGVSLAANVIHHIDSLLVAEVIRKCDFDVYTVHDCLFCSPNNMNILRQHYLDTLLKLADSNLLDHIMMQLTEGDAGYTKYDSTDKLVTSMRGSEYFLS